MKIYLAPELTAKDVMRLYSLPQRAAYRAVKRGYFHKGAAGTAGGKPATRTIQGLKLSNDDSLEIARHTGRRLAPGGITLLAHGKAVSDLRDEIEQAVLIELWISGISDKALAYKAAKRRGIDVLRKWYIKHSIPLEQWVMDNEPEIDDSDYE